MSQIEQLPVPRSSSVSLLVPAGNGAAQAPPPRAEGESFVATARRVHRALRGRYGQAIGLGFLGALIGAVAGWKFAPFEYRSEGLIRIAYELPQVFQETSSNKPMAQMFDAFLQSQKMLITSRRVVDLAIQEPAWQTTGKGMSAKVVTEFAENLAVEVNARTEYIRVAYSDRDPAVAAAGVNAVITAYSGIYNRQDRRVEQQVLTAAEERRKALAAEIDALNAQMEVMSAEFGSTNIDPLYESAMQRVARLQGAITDAQVALARVPVASADARNAIGGPVMSALDLAIAQIAARDPTMRRYCDELATLESQSHMLQRQYGESHPRLQTVRAQIDVMRKRIDDYAEECKAIEGTTRLPAGAPQSKDVLVAEEAQLLKLLEQGKQEMVALGQKRRNLQTLLALRDTNRDELLKVTRRIELLQSEGALGGRLSIVSDGQVPLAPSRNLRPPVIGAAMMIGGCLPAALMLLWSTYKATYRYSDDAQADIGQEVPLLGILPNLIDDDAAQDAVAAQCVHQIRVMLDRTAAEQQSRVYLVTSATAGEGKTSLTLSLGLSFAAAGVRTLVIDCDLAGRRLTRGLSHANLPGLPEALAAGRVNGYVQELAGLSILTAGSAEMLDANTIDASSMRRLLASAREDYSVVLIDTGPILGSIEGCMAAREADGAILTIARGQEHALVSRSLAQLKTLRTHVVGVVFNRAEARDFYRSVYVSTNRVDGLRHETYNRPAIPTRSPFGPLVRAVLASFPKALHLAPPVR